VHIDHIFNKLIRFTGIFYKLRSKLSSDRLKQYILVLFHPHILHGIQFYANTFDTHLDKLRKLKNKILRIIQNKPKRSHITHLYKSYSLLPLDSLYNQQLLFVFKCLYYTHLIPPIFCE